jgi:protoheme IX farnesyltransferase
MWLKRSSPLCTEIGGIAGALPPIIGWAAVNNNIGAPALVVFLIMFLWQPPHFWVLALLRKEEYRSVNIPMLPVVSGEKATKVRTLLYTLALLPATYLLYAIEAVGVGYLIVASMLTLAYIVLTIDFVRKPLSTQLARRLFGFSILYLFSLLLIIAADAQFVLE